MGTPSPSMLRRLAWMAAIWGASVTALGLVAYTLRLAIH